MAEFDALGRDVGAAADSAFHTNEGGAVAGAVKDLWSAVGFDQGDNPNHLWTVSFTNDENGFALTASLKDANVYVSPPHPDIPASEAELARSGVEAAEAPAGEPAASVDAADPVAAEPAPVAVDPAHDLAVAAAQDALAATPNVDDKAAHLAALSADLDAALAEFPDSPQLQDAKAQAAELAGGTDAPGQAPQ